MIVNNKNSEQVEWSSLLPFYFLWLFAELISQPFHLDNSIPSNEVTIFSRIGLTP